MASFIRTIQIVEQAAADNWNEDEAHDAANDPAMSEKFSLMAQWAMLRSGDDHERLVEFMGSYADKMDELSQEMMARGHTRLIISGLMGTVINNPQLLIPTQSGAPDIESIAAVSSIA